MNGLKERKMKKYRTIIADPPWNQKNMAKWKRRPNTKVNLDYPTMTIEEIKNLPVSNMADENSHCWIWTTNQFLPDAIDVLNSWGFKYMSTITWVKPSGVGAWFVNRTQHIVFGYKGKCQFKKRYEPTVYFNNPLRHSQKPDIFHELFERVSYPNRVELFARRKREGWDVFGNEVEDSIDLSEYYT